MKYLIYACLCLFIIPLQIVLFNHLSVANIRPDLALIAVCLIGLYFGEVDAIVVGVVLGFMQDVFSGGPYWANLCLKPIIGVLAALASRNVINLTPTFAFALLLALSVFSGSVMFLLKSLPGEGMDFLAAARGIILLQAAYDAVLGVAALLISQRWMTNRLGFPAGSL